MPQKVRVQVCRVRPGNLPLPRYMTKGAVGMDLYADVDHRVVLPPLGRALIPTGLTIALPEGYEAQIRPRSGLALELGLTVLNAPGTIDPDYREEVKVLLINLGKDPVSIDRGDRIAQLVVAPVLQVVWEKVPQLPPAQRGGGFGHTGKRG